MQDKGETFSTRAALPFTEHFGNVCIWVDTMTEMALLDINGLGAEVLNTPQSRESPGQPRIVPLPIQVSTDIQTCPEPRP